MVLPVTCDSWMTRVVTALTAHHSRQVARLQDPYWWSLHEADAKSDIAVSKRNKWNARGRCIADAVREMKDDEDYNS